MFKHRRRRPPNLATKLTTCFAAIAGFLLLSVAGYSTVTRADSCEDRVVAIQKELGLSVENVAPGGGLASCQAPVDLVSIGKDFFDRDQRLRLAAAGALRLMLNAAKDAGVQLYVLSAYRSVQDQVAIIQRKRDAGATDDDIITSVALPGYSEHHTGQAVDLHTDGAAPLSLKFAATPAFDWLTEHAGQFGFRLTYSQNNRTGIRFEPWHWYYDR